MMIDTTAERIITISNGKHKLLVKLPPETVDDLVALRTKVVTALSSAELHNVAALKQAMFTSIFGF